MCTRLVSALALFIGCVGSPLVAQAREARSEQVPNAQKLDCGVCHVSSSGDGPRNPFGAQIEEMGLNGVGDIETQTVVWSEIFDLDADGDGFTNGYELGDPDGTWVPTDGDPVVFPSLPGDPDSVPCGNGSVHPDEQCDGDDLGGESCLKQGFTGGALACNADCTFDTSACLTAEFPDTGPPVARDMGDDTGPTVSPADSGTADMTTPTSERTPAMDDSGGCGGSSVTSPDAGLDASLFFIVAFALGRRRQSLKSA